MKKLIALMGFYLCTCILQQSSAQPALKLINPKQLTRILFILDGSQSMMNAWDRSSRMEEAKRILTSICDSLASLPNVEIGLRVYGHQYEQSQNNCRDTKLEVAIAKNNIKFIRKKLELLKPKGITPIALTLEKCAIDFPPGPSRNVVILITDGVESCGGDPCEIARQLQIKGIIIKPFVIGLGVPEGIEEGLDCIGQFKNMPNSKSFEKLLGSIISNVLSQTTAEVDLMDEANQATETNVGMTFYDHQTMLLKYVFYHQMNARGNPDTLHLDPVGLYNLTVHTMPPVELNEIAVNANMHTKIPLNTPQGSLRLGTPSKEPIPCLIRKSGGLNTINVQPINTTQRYITGLYDIEILCLPRQVFKNVAIKQTQINSIQIPASGILTIEKNGEIYGGVFYLKDQLWVKLYEFKSKVLNERIALQPGNYRIIYRNKNNRRMQQSIQKDIVIKSNLEQHVVL
jgi:Ca-activated chloride channel family protein